jgi:hypothetical protein
LGGSVTEASWTNLEPLVVPPLGVPHFVYMGWLDLSLGQKSIYREMENETS